MSKRIIIIGAGAAGLMAGCAASKAGADVTIYEQNEKAGKKIYITGKGRCNYTNVCDTTEYFRHVVRNPKFLYSAIYGFDAQQMTAFLEENGCRTKVERGDRAFPASDHASDVTRALVSNLRRNGGHIEYNTGVRRLLATQNKTDPDDAAAPRHVTGVLLANGKAVHADAVIVATGGLSYPSTGSTGDGMRWALDLGLEVTECTPSLVPLETAEDWPRELQGLSLRNVAVKVLPNVQQDEANGTTERRLTRLVNEAAEKELTNSVNATMTNPTQPAQSGKSARRKRIRPVYEGFGEMLFTHWGVSGPLILSASCHLDYREHPAGYILHLDMKPALDAAQLEARIARELRAGDKSITNVLRTLLPGDLPRIVAAQAGIDGTRAAHTINEREVSGIAAIIKDLTMTITGSRGFQEAIITRGGVAVKEINPSTMECRSIRGLYYAGEVIDVDAYTGGYNLQIAWSTGHLAGISAAE